MLEIIIDLLIFIVIPLLGGWIVWNIGGLRKPVKLFGPPKEER